MGVAQRRILLFGNANPRWPSEFARTHRAACATRCLRSNLASARNPQRGYWGLRSDESAGIPSVWSQISIGWHSLYWFQRRFRNTASVFRSDLRYPARRNVRPRAFPHNDSRLNTFGPNTAGVRHYLARTIRGLAGIRDRRSNDFRHKTSFNLDNRCLSSAEMLASC